MLVSELTPGERLRVWRFRNGWSQEAAAQSYGVSPSTYRRYERDEYSAADTPYRVLQTLTDVERCFILRRRAGLTQAQVAERIGRSRWFVNMVENGQVTSNLVARYFGL